MKTTSYGSFLGRCAILLTVGLMIAGLFNDSNHSAIAEDLPGEQQLLVEMLQDSSENTKRFLELINERMIPLSLDTQLAVLKKLTRKIEMIDPSRFSALDIDSVVVITVLENIIAETEAQETFIGTTYVGTYADTVEKYIISTKEGSYVKLKLIGDKRIKHAGFRLPTGRFYTCEWGQCNEIVYAENEAIPGEKTTVTIRYDDKTRAMLHID